MFLEKYTSMKEESISNSKIKNEINVCLKISNFIFSFLLSCIIELCNFIPLTASVIIQGINKIFCNKIVENKNIIPFPNSEDLK